jgi:16S rRNA (adenine1518-N6/adenine1519-N6)-dimethyltransferase
MTGQRLGQHFLADVGWRERIAREILPAGSGGGTWIEIGAGHGEMTPLLAQHAARVVAIELDSTLVPSLRELAAKLGNVSVAHGDVLALNLAELAGGARFSVYGNLPYYITSPIVRRMFEYADRLDAAFILVQYEVAARLAAQPATRDYGYLSVLAQFYSRPEILLRVPPGAFRPPPAVDSALVSLRPPGEQASLRIEDDAQFLDFLKTAFTHKRKTLYNNLRAAWEAERVTDAICASRIDAKARAEQLQLSDFARLFTVLTEPQR